MLAKLEKHYTDGMRTVWSLWTPTKTDTGFVDTGWEKREEGDIYYLCILAKRLGYTGIIGMEQVRFDIMVGENNV